MNDSNDRYRRGSHTVSDIKYHFVWKTKYSYGVLKGEIALRARQILREICAEEKMTIVSGNVRENHIHMLVKVGTEISPAKIAQYLKGKSSHQLQREFKELQKRYWEQHLWAREYFCATVGAVNEEMIKQYIENQREEEGSFKIWDEEYVPERRRDCQEGSRAGSGKFEIQEPVSGTGLLAGFLAVLIRALA